LFRSRLLLLFTVNTGRRLIAENEVVLVGVGRCCDFRVEIVLLLPLLLLSRGFLQV
jgi:hypothetical protein